MGIMKMTNLRKVCPVCRHEWRVIHNSRGLGEIFLRIDFEIFMFDHFQSHSGTFDESRLTTYEYNKAAQC